MTPDCLEIVNDEELADCEVTLPVKEPPEEYTEVVDAKAAAALLASVDWATE
jgi:hypothetical protein